MDMSQYDKDDFTLLRLCGSDGGGPVGWDIGSFRTIGESEYMIRFQRGGNPAISLRFILRRAINAFRGERGSLKDCPWNENYERNQVVAARMLTKEGKRLLALAAQMTGTPQSTPVDEPSAPILLPLPAAIVAHLRSKGSGTHRKQLVEAMGRLGFSDTMVDRELVHLLAANCVIRKEYGRYGIAEAA